LASHHGHLPDLQGGGRRIDVPFHAGVTLHPKSAKEVLNAIAEAFWFDVVLCVYAIGKAEFFELRGVKFAGPAIGTAELPEVG